MKKFFLILLIIITCITVNAEEFSINSPNAIVINLNDNTVLYERNADTKTSIASLTKIMTTLVAIEEINDLSKTVTITDEMFTGLYEYSQAGLKTGDIVTYEDLLYGVILPSGADAVQALEINLAGGRENFAKLMNQKAEELGLVNTHFSNGVGMDSEGNYSTVSDVSKLLMYALENDLFYKIYTTKNYTMTNGLQVSATINHHELDTTLIKGSKTGFTDAAGLCISALYEDKTYKYLVVTTNANYTDGVPYHIKDALTIFNYYLDNYQYVTIFDKNDTITSIPIINGKLDNYDIKVKEPLKLYLKNDINKNNLDLEIKKISNLDENNKKGDYLATLNIKYQDKMLYTKDFILNNSIKFKLDINKILIILLIIFMILLLVYNLLLRKKIHRLILRLKGKSK